MLDGRLSCQAIAGPLQVDGCRQGRCRQRGTSPGQKKGGLRYHRVYPNPVRIPSPFSRQVTVQFNDGTMTSDTGGLLLREADRQVNLLPQLAPCFLDGRELAAFNIRWRK